MHSFDLQIHLSAQECSGRAVRLRKLTPSEKDDASKAAAATMGPDGINVEYAMRETRELVERSILAVSKQRDLTEAEVAELKETDWEPLDQQKLGFDRESPLHYDRLFESKDDAILCSVVNRWLRAQQAEIDAIMGKALRGSKAS